MEEPCRLGEKLGEGAYGAVYISQPDSQTVLKVINDEPGVIIRPLSVVEVDTVCRLRSPYLVEGYGVYSNNECGPKTDATIRLEFCDGPLEQLIGLKGKPRTAYPNLKRLMLHYALGLRCLHRRGILHLDIKADNCMFQIDGEGGYIGKLADFGISAYTGHVVIEKGDQKIRLPKTFVSTTKRITPSYRPPECFEHLEAYTHKADIWSLGLIFFEILSRKGVSEIFDFEHLQGDWDTYIARKIPSVITHKKLEVGLAQIAPKEKTLALDLLKKMLAFDPLDRLDVEGVIDHPYFGAWPPGAQEEKVSFRDAARRLKGDACDALEPFVLPMTLNPEKLTVIQEVVGHVRKDFGNEPAAFLFLALDLGMRLLAGAGPTASRKDLSQLAFLAVHFAVQYYHSDYLYGTPFYSKHPEETKDLKRLDVRSLKMFEGILIRPLLTDYTDSALILASALNDVFFNPQPTVLENYLLLDWAEYVHRQPEDATPVTDVRGLLRLVESIPLLRKIPSLTPQDASQLTEGAEMYAKGLKYLRDLLGKIPTAHSSVAFLAVDFYLRRAYKVPPVDSKLFALAVTAFVYQSLIGSLEGFPHDIERMPEVLGYFNTLTPEGESLMTLPWYLALTEGATLEGLKAMWLRIWVAPLTTVKDYLGWEVKGEIGKIPGTALDPEATIQTVLTWA